MVDPSDSYHRQAGGELRQFSRQRIDVVVSYSTVLEVYSLLMRKLSTQDALRWLREIGAASLINPSPEDYRQATATVESFPDQSISLCDATLAALALRSGMQIWTYDHDFDVMRVAVWRGLDA